jgi:hypothetical protein
MYKCICKNIKKGRDLAQKTDNLINLYGKVATLTFPQAPMQNDEDLGLIFRAKATSAQGYDGSFISDVGSIYADIVLPAPNNIQVANSIGYGFMANDAYWNVGSAYWKEAFTAGNWMPIMQKVHDDVEARDIIENVEASLKAPALRQITYMWNLIPKIKGDSDLISRICKTFQTMAYPIMGPIQKSHSRWQTPPMWLIQIIDLDTGSPSFRWDLGPMPSRLSAVGITPTAGGGIYTTRIDKDKIKSPMVTQLSLTFIEIQPAVAARTDSQSVYFNTSENGVPYLIPLAAARRAGDEVNSKPRVANQDFIRKDI